MNGTAPSTPTEAVPEKLADALANVLGAQQRLFIRQGANRRRRGELGANDKTTRTIEDRGFLRRSD
jgi:hypothetical protein